MASFRSEAEAFSGTSGVFEGHAKRAKGLNPRALARGVRSFQASELQTKFLLLPPCIWEKERGAKLLHSKGFDDVLRLF